MEWEATRTTLEYVAAQVTALLILTVDVVILGLAALGLRGVIRGVRRRRALIHPLEVPKDLEEKGYTAQAMAERLVSEVTSLAKREPLARPGEERFELSTSETDFALPAAGMMDCGYRGFIRFLRELRGQCDDAVRGEFHRDAIGLRLTLRARGQTTGSDLVVRDEDALPELIHAGALAIYAILEPGQFAYEQFHADQAGRDFTPTFEAASRCLAHPSARDHHVAYTARGNALAVLRRFDEARDAFDAALTLAPRYAPAHNGLGILLRATGKLDEAAQRYEAALRSDRRFAAAWNNLGIVCNARRLHASAVRHFNRALARWPSYGPALHGRGIARAGLGRPDLAERDFARAIDVAPAYGGSYVDLARSQHARGARDEAMATLYRAAEYGAPQASIHGCRGDLLIEDLEWNEAEREYGEALEAEPSSAAALANLAQVHRLRGQVAEAADFFERAVAADPYSAFAWERWADMDRSMRRDAAAEEKYERALSLDPYRTAPLVGIALLRRSACDWTGARGWLARAVLKDPTAATPRYWQGRLFASMRDHAQAADAFRTAVALDPRLREARLHLGLALTRLGRIDEGLGEMAQARAASPDGRLARAAGDAAVEMVRVLSDLGRAHAARREIERMAGPGSSGPELSLLRAKAMQAAHRSDEAIAELRRVLEAWPWCAAALVALADELRERGRIDDALSLAQRAIEQEPWNPAAVRALASTLHVRRGPQPATEFLAAAVERLPGEIDLLTAWANILRASARSAEPAERERVYVEADGLLVQAVRLDPYALEARRALAELRSERIAAAEPDPATARERAEAAKIDALHEALAVDQRDWRSWSGIADAKRALGDLRGAERAYRRSLALWPGMREDWSKLRDVLRDAKRVRDAAEVVRWARSVQPADEALGFGLDEPTALT